jgi:small subunit ribosomal protein S9
MAVRPTSTVGRRKTSNARVYITAADSGSEKSTITVNGQDYTKYFPRAVSQQVVLKPLVAAERDGKYNFTVSVAGGGYTGQAGAVLLGISRALIKLEPELRPVLKKAGYLTRDPRVVERKKAGRHKARKSTQFSKR